HGVPVVVLSVGAPPVPPVATSEHHGLGSPLCGHTGGPTPPSTHMHVGSGPISAAIAMARCSAAPALQQPSWPVSILHGNAPCSVQRQSQGASPLGQPSTGAG